jgi:hypothetical protein
MVYVGRSGPHANNAAGTITAAAITAKAAARFGARLMAAIIFFITLSFAGTPLPVLMDLFKLYHKRTKK